MSSYISSLEINFVVVKINLVKKVFDAYWRDSKTIIYMQRPIRNPFTL